MLKAEFFNLPEIFQIAAEFRKAQELGDYEKIKEVRDKYYHMSFEDIEEHRQHLLMVLIAEDIECLTRIYTTDDEIMNNIRSNFYESAYFFNVLEVCVKNINVPLKNREYLNAVYFEICKRFKEYQEALNHE